MISIVRRLGAPVMEPPGNAARTHHRRGIRPQLAADGGDELVDRRVGLHVEDRGHMTDPISHTRPRSLRNRSTIMRFSAWSFSLAAARPQRTSSASSGRAAWCP